MKCKIIYLEWVDSVSSAGWNERKASEKLTCKSAGFLIAEDKIAVTISTSLDSHISCHSPLTIPKVAIKKRQIIRVTK